MISLPVIVPVVSGPIVWRKLVVALRLRFPTTKQDYERMDAADLQPAFGLSAFDGCKTESHCQTLPRRRGASGSELPENP